MKTTKSSNVEAPTIEIKMSELTIEPRWEGRSLQRGTDENFTFSGGYLNYHYNFYNPHRSLRKVNCRRESIKKVFEDLGGVFLFATHCKITVKANEKTFERTMPVNELTALQHRFKLEKEIKDFVTQQLGAP